MRIIRTEAERRLWVYYWLWGFGVGLAAGITGGLVTEAVLALGRAKVLPGE